MDIWVSQRRRSVPVSVKLLLPMLCACYAIQWTLLYFNCNGKSVYETVRLLQPYTVDDGRQTKTKITDTPIEKINNVPNVLLNES